MTAATIPMPDDVAKLIGPAAEKVENRSLLLDKFVFHKMWGLHDIKANDAHRWSLLRIAEHGGVEIAREAAKRRDEADHLARKGTNPEKVTKLRIEAKLAQELAAAAKPPSDLADLRASHTRRFLALFRKAYGDRATVTVGQLEARLAINLADSLIQNAGICLDRLFGLPYIPGSAIKGVCRHGALEDLKSASASERPELLRLVCAVFGTADNDFEKGDLKAYRTIAAQAGRDQKGAIAFLPAYPVNEAKVVVDLTNVHYPDYYRSGRESDLGNENPRPNPFPAVETGAQFAFCLVLNGINEDSSLLQAATRWLEVALTERGIGAKTAAGYGWFSIRNDVLAALDADERKRADAAAEQAEAQRLANEAAAAEAIRKAALSPEAVAAEDLLTLNDEAFAAIAKNLGAEEEVRQRAFLHLLREHREKRERWKTWKKKKPEIAQVIEQTAAKLNLPLP